MTDQSGGRQWCSGPTDDAGSDLEDLANFVHQMTALLAAVVEDGRFIPVEMQKDVRAAWNHAEADLRELAQNLGAQHREVQRLQWFLSESSWDHEQLNQRRVQLSREDPATAPHDAGMLVIDDTRDRKDGTATAHVARLHLGSVVPVTRVLDGVGRYSGEITGGEAAIYSGKTRRSMMAVPSGGEDGHVGSLEQALSHS